MKIRERIAACDKMTNNLGSATVDPMAMSRDTIFRLLALVEAVQWERSGVTMMGVRGPMTRHPTVDEALSALREHGDI